MDIEKPQNYEEELKKLEDQIKNAEENYGDTEVREAIMSKADFFLKHDEDDVAIKTYMQAYEKTVGVSKRLEIYTILLKIYFKKNNLEEIKNYIAKSKQLLEEGGDWENKNKLKVYEGLYCLITRDFVKCARLFVDAMSTFNSPEIMSYEKLTFYTVVSGLMTLPRSEIKEKIINNSEVLCIIRENSDLEGFLQAYYECRYKDFFVYFLKIITMIEEDKNIAVHKKYIIKEMRVMIYSLFLESYKTVTLDCMAAEFGISARFLDKELSGLISSRRLNCKIDKVSGLIESQRIDARNNYYKSALKQGEAILNRIQKLSRVGNV